MFIYRYLQGHNLEYNIVVEKIKNYDFKKSVI